MAHFGVKGPQNESKNSNLLKIITNLKCLTQKFLESKILLKNIVSYKERCTVAHLRVKMTKKRGSKHSSLIKRTSNSKSKTSKPLAKNFSNNYYSERDTVAHIGVKVSQNGSKHSNLPRTTSNSKSTTSKTLERKISLESNNSYSERGTVAHFGVKVPQNGSNHTNLLKMTSNSKSTI